MKYIKKKRITTQEINDFFENNGFETINFCLDEYLEDPSILIVCKRIKESEEMKYVKESFRMYASQKPVLSQFLSYVYNSKYDTRNVVLFELNDYRCESIMDIQEHTSLTSQFQCFMAEKFGENYINDLDYFEANAKPEDEDIEEV